MGIGAVGGYNAVMFNPYVYNTNQLNRASLGKVDSIPDDTLAAKTDFSSLSNVENVNPLRPGETKNFADILASQFAMAQSRAAVVMKTGEEIINEAAVQ